MASLKLIKSESFGNVQADIYSDNKDMYMTALQLGECLGYSDPMRSINRIVSRNDYLESDEFSSVVSLTTVDGKQRNARVFTEDGIYEITMLSKTEKAKEFRSWVRGVLTSIRKHGGYLTPKKLEEVLLNPDVLIQLAQNLKEEQEKRKVLETEVAVNKQVIQELQPKASYYDVVLNCKDLISTSKIAKDYGLSAVKLNSLLHALKIQYKQGNVWLLYQKYAEKGYTNTKTHTYNKPDGTQGASVHTYWTQKGRLFIYDLLKSKGITPLIERKSA